MRRTPFGRHSVESLPVSQCPAPNLVIISRFELSHNPKTGKIHVVSKENPVCPRCHQSMVFRDTCVRGGLSIEGKCQQYVIRRLECPSCKAVHRELPDILFPYKHYETDVIQSVIVGRADGCAADESTIQRWKRQWRTRKARLLVVLAGLLAQTSGSVPKLVGRRQDIFLSIRQLHPRWLAFVLRLLTAGNVPLYTQFAFCHSP